MKIAIDIDGTINENPKFFKRLLDGFDGEVHILTGRPVEEKERTIEELQKNGIKYDKVSFVSPKELNSNSKKDYCIENNIEVIIDDDDEYTLELPESIFLLKPRAKSNFEFSTNCWKPVKRYD